MEKDAVALLPSMTTSMLSIAQHHKHALPSTSLHKEDTVARQWTFEYKQVVIPEEKEIEPDTIPEEVQQVLKVAACLESLDITLCHAVVASESSINISDCLAKATKLGLIVQSGQDDSLYTFLNTETQEAAYALLPQDEKALFHLQVGRNLAKNLSPDDIDTHLFTILRQFYCGRNEMTSNNEKKAIASLCTRAAPESVSTSNFVAAIMYLEFGLELMGDNPWQNDYALTLALYNAAAEVECCLANFHQMDVYVGQVLLNARTFRDSLLARSTRVYSLGGRGRTVEAVKEGLDILQQLGISFPKRATRLHVAVELFMSQRLLRNKTNETILRMKHSNNANMISAMQVLNIIFPNVFKTDPYLAFLVASKMVSLSLQHGLCVISSVAFSMYGTMFCSHTSKRQEGYRFGQLALALLDRFGSREWLPRVYFGVYGNIFRHARPQSQLIGPLHQAYTVGMETGDVEFAMLNASLHVAFMLFGGQALSKLEAQAKEYIVVMESHQQVSALLKTKSILRFVENLMGKTDDPLKLCDDDESLDHDMASARVTNLMSVWCSFQHMILAYLLADYEQAEAHAVSFRSLRKYLHFKSSFGFISLVEGLALLSVCDKRPQRVKRRHLAVVRQNIAQLQKEALNNPNDVAGKAFLLEAELARVLGKLDVARYKFTCAVAVSRQSNIVLDHAMACERAGRFMESVGETVPATEYLQQACVSYEEWGAAYKVQQLQSELSAD